MKIILILFVMVLWVDAKDYSKSANVQKFISSLVKEYSMDINYLEKLFSNVKKQELPLGIFASKKKKISGQKKRTDAQRAASRKLQAKYGPWERYRRFKVNPKRVQQGVEFIKKHQKIFDKVEKKYGVPREYIAAIIGIETVYGNNVGKYPVFDTLTTLAFEKNRRNTFFKKQLKLFIRLSQTEKFNPKNVYGSYAGAIGLVQFMPSNYEPYGVDFNGDGRITLQRPADAIASVANYFKKNGWRKGEPVATRVSYNGKRFKAYKTGYTKTHHRANLKGIAPKVKWDYSDKVRLIKLNKKMYDELWYGAKNFYVITRYNHSAYYAMSVHQLAQEIKAKL